MLKYNIRTRSLADPGTIEDVLAVENDVVPFDRADVLGAPGRSGGRRGCRVAARPSLVTASARPVRVICLLANWLPRREDHGQVSIIMSVLIDVS